MGGYGYGRRGSEHVQYVVGGILGIIGLLSVGWSLATIGEAEGERRVFGITITRRFFDIVIYVYFLINMGIFIAWFFGLNEAAGSIVWNITWLLIIPFSIMATLQPRYPSRGDGV
ncbi:hypothetical protein LTR10_005370 [Elasticomyces elasticus]|nr:hypothetical protein LTR10_005370 [Elasticomyces elasticus]KAK4976108.1 hypothetical protein LTR42_003733 [Elasticomyces elasticus]